MKTQAITVKLSLNGIDISVGHHFLSEIAKEIPDVPENIEVFELLSTSESKDVREEMANKDVINRTMVKHLLQEKEDDVLKQLIWNDNAAKLMKEDEVLDIIENGSAEVVKKVITNLYNFDRCDICKLGMLLSEHPDPCVRYELAESPQYFRKHNMWPKQILKKLAKDPDADVARAARESLEEK